MPARRPPSAIGSSTPTARAPARPTRPALSRAPAAPVAPVLTPTAPAVTNQPQSTTAVDPTGGSVSLVDGNGDPATTVTVPGEGTFVLDPSTGVITFTPVLGFTGTPAPVDYRVTDAYDQFTDSTFAPSPVTAPAAPGRAAGHPRALPRSPTSHSRPPSPSRPAARSAWWTATATRRRRSRSPARAPTSSTRSPASSPSRLRPDSPGHRRRRATQITDAYGQTRHRTFAPAWSRWCRAPRPA